MTATFANYTLEKAVLQAAIMHPDKRRAPYLGALTPNCFEDPRNRQFWELVADLYREYPNFDLPMLVDRLKPSNSDGGVWQETGSGTYLLNEVLPDAYWVPPANCRVHIRRLRELARERLQQEIGQQMAMGTLNGHLTEALDQLRAPIWPEEEAQESGAEAMAEAVVADWNRALELQKSGRLFAGYDCGFDKVNERLNGLCAGQLTVLASRPKIGKSTLAIQMALHVAQIESKTVGIISLEMTREQIGSRAACILADVDSRLQQRGQLKPEEQKQFTEGISRLAGLPLKVWIKEHDIDAIAARIRQETSVDLWVVDHLHRIDGHGDTDHERYGSTAKILANLAVEINKHILLLSQLNRDCEDRSDKRPQVGDLRGSGSIEEHAVNVLMIYRPGFYDELKERAKRDPIALEHLLTEVQIICEATRFGVPGTDALAWVPNRGTFASLAPTYRQEPTGGHHEHRHANNA